MKNYVLLLVCLIASSTFAQEDAWVFFADKENVAESIANPISILTQEAIDRKEMHNVVIDERDVPVTESYITEIKNATGINVSAKSKWMNCIYVTGSQMNIENLLDLPFVTSVEYADKSLNFFPEIDRTVNKFEMENTSSRIDYNYGAAANQIEMLKGDFLHEQDFAGQGMIIGVLDAGFPSVNTNPGFANMLSDGRLLGTFDFEQRSTNVDGTSTHGTRTASDMGGFLENQFVGTAPEASYYLFVTEYTPSETPVEEAWWVAALERSDSLGVDVINTSLSYRGYDNSNYDHTYEDLDGQTTFAARGGNIAFEKGMIMVNSAGNGGNSDFPTVGTPADAIGVFTIGAVAPSGNYASFSSKGPTVDGRVKPDVMAQGQDAAVIGTNGGVDFNNGTSFSSPILAGAIACLWQARPEVTNSEIMQLVRESSHLYNNPTNEMGYGIPNFEDAYNELLILGIEDDFLKSNFALYPNPTSDILNISFPQELNKAQFDLYSVLGTKIMSTEISSELNSVSIESLATGIYIATISEGKHQVSFKIVKK
ncbi:MAG: serine protease AprX [Flavobacteriaceae bacterium]|jgi:subtilisin family serine protease|uniref:S8 family serine peptidase n=1 Tax=Candidatus Marifrigoribacter sp. Uisw_064 TaxID=3230970 RepID=UPI003AE6F0FB